MAQYFRIHPKDPQKRLIQQAAKIMRDGGVVVYPTDSCYALGCQIGDKAAVERIRRLRRLGPRHNMTLVCSDLSEIGVYARVENTAYRLIKALTPGPYTFILKATREVPRRLQDPERRTIGLRVPDNVIARALMEALGEPSMSTTLILPNGGMPLTDPEDISEKLAHEVELVIDGGIGGLEPTTVLDLVDEMPRVLRKGKGDISLFED
ncbi:MAG: threonylcarbamoyl-AMP synthase [Gammaproteobacteria bacterium]|nr:threonylcarbamoyl-AMP synthase [Gammaproteobacteria bacterium]